MEGGTMFVEPLVCARLKTCNLIKFSSEGF